MARTAGRRATRLDVASADGTPLAVWVDGDGPPLVLVHGSMCDHTAFAALVTELRDHVTTFAMDRRGFGASGDAPEWALEREFEDVAAVVEEVAARTGRPVAVWGHSFGANAAMGGAAVASHVHRLVLYEPSLGIAYPAGSIEAIEAQLAAGDVEGAMLAILIGVAGMTEEEAAALRSSPTWPARLATAPTVVRECVVEDTWVYRPGRFHGVTAPTLLLTGSESPPAVARATAAAATAIPGARVRVLEGHGHFAYRTDPGMVAGIVRECVVS